MRLSLSWLIIVLLFIYILYFCQYGWKIYEDFHSTIEGFQTTTDISMSSCPPSESDESIPMRGSVPAGSTQTFCMDSSIQKCSLSVAKESPESCTQYYLALLQSKAALRCPRSMPNYYQNINYSNNVDKSTRGCTSGARTADGKAPATSESKCTIYTSQMDDLQKLDSCTNIKRLESAQCFSSAVAGVTSALKANTFGSPFIECTFSQIESVKTGSKTTDTNAAAIAAQTAKRAMTAAENAKYDKARQVVAKLGAQGTLVNVDSSSYNITKPMRSIVLLAGEKGNYINLSQIQVIDDKGNNVTRNGRMDSSGAEYNTSPNTAVDGSYYPRAFPNIYHSGNDAYSYFRIFFEQPVNVASVTLYNRTDCCMDRLSKCQLYFLGEVDGFNVEIQQRLTADLVQTYSFLPPVKTDTDAVIQANLVTEDIFSPESVTYNCTELDSYRSWIDSIRTLYPAKYEASKHNLDSSETWSADKKNTFCTILEQTKIRKTMTNSQLKTTSVL